MKKASLQIFTAALTAILMLGLLCGTASADPVIIAPSENATVQGIVDEVKSFSIQTNEIAQIDWSVNGSSVSQTIYYTETNTSYYNHTVEPGTFDVKATVRATGDSRTWTLISDNRPVISLEPSSPVSNNVGESRTFTATVSQTSNMKWYLNDAEIQTNESVDSSTYTNSSAVAGTYTLRVEAENANGTADSKSWTWTVASNVPVITLSNPSSPVSNNVGESRTFTATVSQTSNMKWYLNDAEIQTNESVDSSTYTNSSAVAGTYTLRVGAENANGTADPKSWTWTVGTSTVEVPVNIDPAEGTVEIAQGVTKTFYVNHTNGQNINVEWFVDNESKANQTGPSTSYDFKQDIPKEYTLKAVITDPSNPSASSTKTWTVKVQSKNHSKGNRIWDEGLGLSDTYTWDAQSYSGFYYDLDAGVSSEEMTISHIKRNIDDGDIEYVTRPTETKFKYRGWGSYQIIGFMAEKYFAGYTDNTTNSEVSRVSLISNGILAKILADNNDRKSAYSGDALVLENGYSLNVVEVDVNGNTVWVQLEKDGDVVDDAFIASGQDYVYKTDLGKAEDVPIIIVRFGTVFAGTETSAVFIQGLFQVSDEYVELKRGDSFGEMEVTSLSSSEIKMKNEDAISLGEGDIIDLMGKIKIQVADSSRLRFAPILDTSEEGTYELRGTVYDEDIDKSLPITWTPFNFEGFYYNIDEGIGTEKLSVEQLSGREIPSGKLVYESSPQPVQFEYKNWGNFTVVGFMAEKYFAGYPDGAVRGEVGRVSLLSDKVLSKVLIDSKERKSMYSGSALVLEEGYSLNIMEVDVNGNTVWVQLEKDGDVVDDGFISSGQDYIYETDLGKAEDVPIIIVNFGTVFAGTETSAVFTQGIFQISDDFIEINNGDTFDEMKITSVSESGIIMKSDDDIGLDDDETIDVMNNIKFKTADSSTLRFYPLVEVETEAGASRELKITVPDEIIIGDTFDIVVTAGENPIEGATVKVNATTAGKTNADGVVEYTADKEGAFKLTAEKERYTTANKEIKVIPPKEKMSLNTSPETVYVGDVITIEALKTIGGDPIEGANISIDGKALGKTGSDGKITYTTEEVGKIRVTSTREGFLDKSVEITVKDYEAIFQFSNLVINPLEVRAGKEATISVDAKNAGNAAGEYNVELFVNGNSVSSQQISLGVGESTKVEFKHSEETPGTYTVKVGGQEAEYTVKEKSSMLLYSLIGIILLLGGGIAYMFTKGGWTMATLQSKVDELVKSANLKR